MILSDTDLKARLEQGDLVVFPMDDPGLQIQPASIDLRLGNSFVMYKRPQGTCIDARDLRSVENHTEAIEIADGEGFELQPGAFALGSTVEYVHMPHDLVGRLEGRSSIGRIGVAVHATVGFIDPGFRGRINLELANLGRFAVKLYPGMRVSQIVLHTMSSPAKRPYGTARNSKYQGQTGPVVSRIGRERPRYVRDVQ